MITMLQQAMNRPTATGESGYDIAPDGLPLDRHAPHPLLPAPHGRLHALQAGERMATVMHGTPHIRTEETRWIGMAQWDEETALPMTNRAQRDYERFITGIRNALLITLGAAGVAALVRAFTMGGW